MIEIDLKNLLLRAQKGDEKAFGLIYDHFRERIYRFIYFRVGHKELAEDILSDTFVKAWQRLSDLNSPEALSSWIYRVAKNNIIDYYRIKRVTVSIEEIEEVTENLTDEADPVDSTNISIEQRVVLELMDQLPEDQRQIIAYKFFEDLTNQEIASIMNKTEVSVRVIQHRAINKLKQLLNRRIKKP
ncbi:MAG: RNA polymerase sigma factor [Acidobacteriaceae bacterium]